jgi:hypothetical protein
MRRFNKLEEAILKMVKKSNQPDNTVDVKLNDEQDIIDYNVIDNVIEEESEMDNYNEMKNDDTTGI